MRLMRASSKFLYANLDKPVLKSCKTMLWSMQRKGNFVPRILARPILLCYKHSFSRLLSNSAFRCYLPLQQNCKVFSFFITEERLFA